MLSIGTAAEKDGDRRAALMAIRELVRIADLMARMQGDVKELTGSTVNVVVHSFDKQIALPSSTPPALPPGERAA